MATAATAIALNGFKVEVLASSSACSIITRPTRLQFRITADGSTVSGSGAHPTMEGAKAAAIISLAQNLSDQGKLVEIPPSTPPADPPITNPAVTNSQTCSQAPVASVTTTRSPQVPGNGMQWTGPVWDSARNKYVSTVSNELEPSGEVTITVNISYGTCPH